MSASITWILVLLNGVAFLLQNFVGFELIQWFGLWPFGPYFHIWQIITYAFLHGSFTHILFNMFGLNMFGSEVELRIGPYRYLVYYFTCVITAALAQLAVSSGTGAVYPTIGASGGIFGLLLAFAILFPDRKITPLIPPIPMTAPVFVSIYGGIELVLGITGSEAGVAHFAHLGGMVGGLLVFLYWRVLSGGSR